MLLRQRLAEKMGKKVWTCSLRPYSGCRFACMGGANRRGGRSYHLACHFRCEGSPMHAMAWNHNQANIVPQITSTRFQGSQAGPMFRCKKYRRKYAGVVTSRCVTQGTVDSGKDIRLASVMIIKGGYKKCADGHRNSPATLGFQSTHTDARATPCLTPCWWRDFNSIVEEIVHCTRVDLRQRQHPVETSFD